MSAEQNARLVQESLEAAFHGNWPRLKETYAENAILMGGSLEIKGNDAIVNLWRGCHEEEKQFDGEILNVVASGDMVAIEFRHCGIVNELLPNMPEALLGKRFEGKEVHMCKVRDSKIISTIIYSGFGHSPDIPIKNVWLVNDGTG